MAAMMDTSNDPGQQQAVAEISPNDVEWVYEVQTALVPRDASFHCSGRRGRATEAWVWWQMRRVMQEIVPRLFLGPYASGKKKDELKVRSCTTLFLRSRGFPPGLTSVTPCLSSGARHHPHHDCALCD